MTRLKHDDQHGFAHPRWIIALLVVAFIVRLAWALHLPTDDSSLQRLPDQREYLELGRNLLAGHGLVFRDPRFEADVRAYRTPGYPLLVAACGANVRVVRIVQALLDTSTVLAAYILARHWLSPARSVFAAAIVAVNPFLIFFTGLVLSETLFVAMLAWGMALLPRRWIVGTPILALSVLVRPSALLLPAVLAMVSCWLNPRLGEPYHLSTKALLVRAGSGALMTVFVLGPWAIRNAAVVHAWVWTTTNGGITLYDGFNPAATGASDQSFVSRMPELRGMNEVERSRYLSQLARMWARENPLRVARLTVAKIDRTWSPIPLSREYGRQPLYVWTGLLYSLPLDVLAILGLITSGALSRPAKLMLLLPALYFTAVHALSVGSLRYRIPAEVPMAVLAAAAFARREPEMKRSEAASVAA